MIPQIERTEIPKPVKHVDFYLSELRSYHVAIEIVVGGFAEVVDDVDMQTKAVNGFRDGSLDGDAQVVHSEKIRDIELDFETDLPFDRVKWLKAAMAAQGLRPNGDPLRPYEKVRPAAETVLQDFPSRSGVSLALARVTRWCRRAFAGVF